MQVSEGRKGLVRGSDVKMALLKHDVVVSDTEARDLAVWLVPLSGLSIRWYLYLACLFF